MIIESKWMVLGCALALVIGVSLVSPLLMLHTVINPFPKNPQVNPNPQSSQSQITVNLQNIYLEVGNRTKQNSFGTFTQPVFSGVIHFGSTKYLNSNQDIPDAEVDCFLLELFTDNDTKIQDEFQNYAFYIGTAYNISFTPEKMSLIDSSLNDSFGMIFGGAFIYRWSIGTPMPMPYEQSFIGDIAQSSVDSIKNCNTLTMTLTRLGTITIRGNATLTSTSDAGLVESVTLTKYGNGFMYNHDGSSFPVPIPDCIYR